MIAQKHDAISLRQLSFLLLRPRERCRSIVMSTSVCLCLSLCLSVRGDISETTLAIFTRFSVHFAHGRGLDFFRQGEVPRGRGNFVGVSFPLTMYCNAFAANGIAAGKGVMGVHSAGEVWSTIALFVNCAWSDARPISFDSYKDDTKTEIGLLQKRFRSETFLRQARCPAKLMQSSGQYFTTSLNATVKLTCIKISNDYTSASVNDWCMSPLGIAASWNEVQQIRGTSVHLVCVFSDTKPLYHYCAKYK